MPKQVSCIKRYTFRKDRSLRLTPKDGFTPHDIINEVKASMQEMANGNSEYAEEFVKTHLTIEENSVIMQPTDQDRERWEKTNIDFDKIL